MGIIQGFIFGFVILLNKKLNNRTNLFLVFTSFSLSISNLQYWAVDTKLSELYPILNKIRIPTEFLIVPMFYLFVTNYLDVKESKKKNLILILPFIIDFGFNFFIFYLHIDQQFFSINKKIVGTTFLEEFLCFLFSFFLIIKLLRLVKKESEIHYQKFKVIPETKWLVDLLKIGVFTCFLWVVGIVVFSYGNFLNGIKIFYPLWITITIVIYWLSYISLIKSNILHERKEIRKSILLVSKETNVSEMKNKTEGLFGNFENYVKEHFLDPELSLELVAEKINVNPSYLSQVINSQQIKFNDYINQLRIEKAKEMLGDCNYSNFTITAIGFESGFNSNASFYRAFKKHTGMSPSEFKK